MEEKKPIEEQTIENTVVLDELKEPSNEATVSTSVTPEVPSSEIPVNTTSMPSGEKEKCLYKPNIPLLVSVTLLAVGIIIGGLVMYINSKPSLVFKKVINSGFLSIENMLVEDEKVDFDSFNTKMQLGMDIKTSDESIQEMLDIFNELSLDMEIGADLKKNILAMNVSADYEEENMIDMDVVGEGKRAYVDFKDVFEHPYYTELEEELTFESDENVNYEAVREVIAGIREAVNYSIKDSYITKEKDGEYTKYTLTVDEDNANKLAIDFLTYLKNNDEFIDAYVKLTEDSSKENVKKSIEDSIKEIKDSNETLNGVIKVAFYMDGNDLKQADVDITSNEETLKASVKVVNENTYNYSVVGFGMKVSGSINLNEDDKGNGNYVFNVALSQNDEELFDATFTIRFETEYDVKISNNLKKDATDINDLTEEEDQAITERLLENEALVKFVEDIEAIMPEPDYGTDDPYDSDFDYDSDYDYDSDFDYDYDSDFDYDYNYEE